MIDKKLERYYRDYRTPCECPKQVHRPDEIAKDATRAYLLRQKNSHRGIGAKTNLTEFHANSVDQPFLDEIGDLQNLEWLSLTHVTAKDLTPLTKLPKLSTLYLDLVREADDLSPIAGIPQLTRLRVSEPKRVGDLEYLAGADKVIAFMTAGGMWSDLKLESLRPLAYLPRLEYVLMPSVRLVDKDLSCIADIRTLKYFNVARFAPKREFVALRRLRPDLDCHWCDKYEV